MINHRYVNFKKTGTVSPVAGGSPQKTSLNYTYSKPIAIDFIEIITTPVQTIPFRVNIFSIEDPGGTETVNQTIADEIIIPVTSYHKIELEYNSVRLKEGVTNALKCEVIAPPRSTTFTWWANIEYKLLQ